MEKSRRSMVYLSQDAHRLLKVLAAVRGVPATKLAEHLIRAEEERARRQEETPERGVR